MRKQGQAGHLCQSQHQFRLSEGQLVQWPRTQRSGRKAMEPTSEQEPRAAHIQPYASHFIFLQVREETCQNKLSGSRGLSKEPPITLSPIILLLCKAAVPAPA